MGEHVVHARLFPYHPPKAMGAAAAAAWVARCWAGRWRTIAGGARLAWTTGLAHSAPIELACPDIWHLLELASRSGPKMIGHTILRCLIAVHAPQP